MSQIAPSLPKFRPMTCGQCPMSMKEFPTQLANTVQPMLSACLRQLGCSHAFINEIKVNAGAEGIKEYREGRAIEWIDGELDCSGFVVIQWEKERSEHFIDSLRKSLISLLSGSVFTTRRTRAVVKEYSVELHLLLWMCVELGDWHTLSNVMEVVEPIVPRCAKNSLLLKAIRLADEDCVTHLLKSGCPVLYPRSKKGIHRPIFMSVWLICEAARTRRRGHPLTWGQSHGHILKILLRKAVSNDEFKVYLFHPPPNHDDLIGSLYSSLFFIVDIAVFDPEAALMLIEIGSPFLNVYSESPSESPIFAAFASLEYLINSQQCSTSYTPIDVARMLNGGILSLIRAGARCHVQMTFSLARRLHGILERLFSYSPVFPQFLLQMFIESQRIPNQLVAPHLYASPNLIECVADYTNFWDPSPVFLQVDHSRDALLLKEIAQRFPFSLKCLCRRVILSSLPTGFMLRREAILNMQFGHLLPDLTTRYDLTGYLLFNDLEIGVNFDKK